MNSLLAKARKQTLEHSLSGCHPLLARGLDAEAVEFYFSGLILTRMVMKDGGPQIDEVLRKRQCALGISESNANAILKQLYRKNNEELLDEIDIVVSMLSNSNSGILFLEEVTCLWFEYGGSRKDLLEFQSSMMRRMSLNPKFLDVFAAIDVALERKDGKSLLSVSELTKTDFQYLFLCAGMANPTETVSDYVDLTHRQEVDEVLRKQNREPQRKMVLQILEKINNDKYRNKYTLDPVEVANIENLSTDIDAANVDWPVTIYKVLHKVSSGALRICAWQLVFLLAIKYKKISDVILNDVEKLLVAINKVNGDSGYFLAKFRAICKRHLKDELDLGFSRPGNR